jgi:hypothetical protein
MSPRAHAAAPVSPVVASAYKKGSFAGILTKGALSRKTNRNSYARNSEKRDAVRGEATP